MLDDGAAPGRAWLMLAVALAAGSLLAWWLPAPWLDWQPERVWHEPWRAFTSAFVHWSERHLLANLLGLAIVAALGRAGRLPGRAALAWFIAWPLTHGLLGAQPQLLHYGGLSGLLHAGVAVAGLWLMLAAGGRSSGRRERLVGAAILAGLAAKIALERPWSGPLIHGAEWDIAIAPLAHAAGAASGLACAALAWFLRGEHRQSAR